MKRLTAAREAETKYIKEQNELEISKTGELAAIESDKFKQMVTSIGAETIQSIATAGPEMQVCTTYYFHYLLVDVLIDGIILVMSLEASVKTARRVFVTPGK